MNHFKRFTFQSNVRNTRVFSLPALHDRRHALKTILQEQINIAEMLSRTEGIDSKATRWAWDVVEEVSKKLNRVEDTIYHSYIDEHDRARKSIYDEELSRREYDL